MKLFSKRVTKIVSSVLLVAILIGAFVGVSSFLNRKTKTISSLAFAVGSIDEDGQYMKSDQAIYTKEYIACEGLTIQPSFEASGKYRVFYYDGSKNFVGASNMINAGEGVYMRANEFSEAVYCKIAIFPTVSSSGSTFRIKFYEAVKYANEYTIKVNKSQPIASFFSNIESNYYVVSYVFGGERRYNPSDNSTIVDSASGLYYFGKDPHVVGSEMIIRVPTNYLENVGRDYNDIIYGDINIRCDDGLIPIIKRSEAYSVILETKDYSYISIDISENTYTCFLVNEEYGDELIVWVR